MKVKLSEAFWKWVLTILGVAFICVVIMQLSLGLIGVSANGVITSYRRNGGERAEAIPNRYTYSLGYSYRIDGKHYTGTSTVIGSPLFIKPSGNDSINVRYFHFAPMISVLEAETTLNLGHGVMFGVGVFLINVLKPKRNK